MSGILYLVATPIGNLEDMTYRAVRILSEADIIAAEDTRNSIKLLNHFEIKTPMTSYHEFNKYDKADKLIGDLLAGKNVAVITDAGTPGISDPGEVLVDKAYDNGIDFFDTARAYTDSEEKIGQALSDVRGDIFIASKTMATDAEKMWEDLETTLENLKTDYLDLYQFHNPSYCPKPGDGTGLYEAAMKAKEKGMIRHLGITNHRLAVAKEAIGSDLYETLQFPFSYLADEKEVELVKMCKEHDMGFICMKSLAGGLINKADAAYAYLSQFDNALPIWGIQHEHELDEFLAFNDDPPKMDEEMKAFIEKERAELTGDFCRSCGYCMPCPVGIQIFQCNRMSLLLRRMPKDVWLTEKWQEEMNKIDDCIGCRQCVEKCPYGLDIPNTLKKNLEDYRTFL